MHRTPPPPPTGRSRRVTLHDVAEHCGVSICTVNKALGNKGALRPETRRAVQEAARRLGYRPNRIAQTLVRRPVTLGVVYPRGYWPSYYGPLVAAVEQGIAAMDDHGVRAQIRPVARPGRAAAYQQAICQLLDEKVDGLVLCPGLVSPGAAAWQRIRESGVPLALLGNDIAEAPRLTCVTNDSVRSGRLAAELLAKTARGKPAAVIVGSLALADHAEKLRGFEEAAGELGLPLAEVCQSHDDPALSYPLARRLLDEHPGLGGLYIGTDNGAEVCRCVWDRGLAGKVAVVATGTFPEIREYLRKKVVQFTFFQNMPRQGTTVVEVLARHLLDGRVPPPLIRIPPDIVAGGNLDLYGP